MYKITIKDIRLIFQKYFLELGYKKYKNIWYKNFENGFYAYFNIDRSSFSDTFRLYYDICIEGIMEDSFYPDLFKLPIMNCKFIKLIIEENDRHRFIKLQNYEKLCYEEIEENIREYMSILNKYKAIEFCESLCNFKNMKEYIELENQWKYFIVQLITSKQMLDFANKQLSIPQP